MALKIKDDWIATADRGIVVVGYLVADGDQHLAQFVSKEDAELFVWAKALSASVYSGFVFGDSRSPGPQGGVLEALPEPDAVLKSE